MLFFYVWSNLKLAPEQLGVFIKCSIGGMLVVGSITNIMNFFLIKPIKNISKNSYAMKVMKKKNTRPH